jgi:hypothetical protein
MIVYVESNFVLEIALQREEYSSAEAILSLAENNKIELRFPGFILSETFGALRYRRGKRLNLYRSLQTTLKDIKRSASLREAALSMESLIGILENALETDFDVLHSTLSRMLSKGKAVIIDQNVFQDALTRKNRLDLSLSTIKQLFREWGILLGGGENQHEKTSRDPHPDSRRIGSVRKAVSNHKRGAVAHTSANNPAGWRAANDSASHCPDCA